MDSPHLIPLHSPRSIRRAVRRLAGEIDRDHGGDTLTLVGVLNGSFVFLADLIRSLRSPVTVDFIRVSSYGRGTFPGPIRLVKDMEAPVRGRKVVLVDDIVDTGHTTRYLQQRLRRRRPSILRLCALLDKPSRREVAVDIDYRGFVVPDKFIVGYGLDMDGRYRQLPGLCIIKAPPGRGQAP